MKYSHQFKAVYQEFSLNALDEGHDAVLFSYSLTPDSVTVLIDSISGDSATNSHFLVVPCKDTSYYLEQLL
jgi:hypothetical protein